MRFTAMNNVHRTGCSSFLIDLKSHASRSNHTAPNIDLIGSDDKTTNYSPEIVDLTDDEMQHFSSNIPVIDLTDDEIQYFSSNIPVIDLTRDNDQCLNYRIPVVDLTNDDVNGIAHQARCIDLTYNDVSSSNQTIRNFNFRGISVGDINRSKNLIDLTADDIQDYNPKTPIIDLTCDNDQFPNCTIQDIDMTNDDIQDITQSLHTFNLVDGKQQNIYECIPSINLTNPSYQSIDRIVSANDQANNKDYNNIRPIIDMIQNDDRVIEKPVDDMEMHDLSYDNAPKCFQKGAMENNLKVQAENLNYNVTENDILNCNETSSMNVMHRNIFSNMEKFHLQKEILKKNSLKNNLEDRSERILPDCPMLNNFEVRKETVLSHCPIINNFGGETETILTNHPLRNNFENRKERILTNNSRINNSEGRKETVLTHHLQTNNHEKYFRQEKVKKLSRRNTSDFLKPAHHPIPLRHSLGKSTVNTSPNTRIEFTEGSEDQSRILTVSSIIRRKKLKSNVISKHALPKSKKQPTSRENTFPSETFKGFNRKFWIFLLLTFIGLYILLVLNAWFLKR